MWSWLRGFRCRSADDHRRRAELVCTSLGLRVLDGTGVEYWFVAWNDVEEISAYKEDELTTDCVWVAVKRRSDQLFLSFPEGTRGFWPLLEELPRRFEGIPESWWSDVTRVAFERSFMVLYSAPSRSLVDDPARS